MNPLAILTLIATYGPTVLQVLETVGPPLYSAVKKIVPLIEASHSAGTLAADAAGLTSGLGAIVNAAGDLGQLGDLFTSAASIDIANPLPGESDPRVGSRAR